MSKLKNKKIWLNLLAALVIISTASIVIYIATRKTSNNFIEKVLSIDLQKSLNNQRVAKSLKLDLNKKTSEVPNNKKPDLIKNQYFFRINTYNFQINQVEGWKIYNDHILIKTFIYSYIDDSTNHQKVLNNFKIIGFKKVINKN